MRQSLKIHPEFRCDAVTAIEVAISEPRKHCLELGYVVKGNIADLKLPAVASPVRTSGLWQHTCFEVFLRGRESAAYQEFNFSPSTQWAAYHFKKHREGMRDVDDMGPPRIKVRSSDHEFHLQTSLEWNRLQPGTRWHLGLSAVIEELSGAKSYWALAHPKGKPDFHHADCFTHELAVAS